jgi:lipid II:glycine glycyltransferase (peptidoglycan interpeptide bridge formation enzyme)
MCALMKRNLLDYGVDEYFDLITPYGYGGFLFEGETSEENMRVFSEVFKQWLKENRIVSVFYRFHPQLCTADRANCYCSPIFLGYTIEMDISNEDVIWSNITSKNRNMIRKAKKNGITIGHGFSWKLFTEFKAMYDATMKKDNAEEYYFFNEDFYLSIFENMKDVCEMFYAEYEGKKIAMSMMLFTNGRMHYHLSGSVLEYRNLAPSNLLLYEAAKWGCLRGLHTFHLGGGVGSGEDNLFKFKKEFNRNSNIEFAIGKQICNKEIYNKLVEICCNRTDFDKENKFFPLYRAF